jgi:hypothetical protein
MANNLMLNDIANTPACRNTMETVIGHLKAVFAKS